MRTLLIDDHTLFRQGLKFILSDLDDSIAFLEAESCEAALEMSDGKPIELILLDYHLPGVEGISALHAVKAHFDASAIVVLSSEDDPQIIRSSIESGALGFIPKAATPEVLIAALRLILAGGTYLPPGVLDQVKNPTKPQEDNKPSPAELLSERQLQVLLKAVQGKANKVIAREMHISEGTVKAHLSASFRALGVQNRTEAVFMAAKLGLTPPGSLQTSQ